jgi:hypothetical protein
VELKNYIVKQVKDKDCAMRAVSCLLLLALLTTLCDPLLAVFNPVAVFGSGSCKTLSPAGRLQNPCAGIVNYSYYVPATKSDAQLAALARATLNSTLIPSVSMSCQQHVVRYACSQIYLKCQPGLDLSNASTYNSLVYPAATTITVPFQRPCKSVCTEFPGNCTGAGLLVAFPLVASAAKCSSLTTAYLGSTAPSVATFHPNDNKDQCHAPSTPSLAGAVETYDKTSPTAVCAAFVDTFYVPPGTKINPTYAALLPPATAQHILDLGLSAVFSQMKPFLSSECMLAMKKRFCYSYYLQYDEVLVVDALKAGLTSPQVLGGIKYNPALSPMLTGKITVPSYPAYHYCTDFTESCAAVIAKAPALAVNCNGTTVNTDGTVYRIFPEKGKQLLSTVLKTVSVPLPAPTMSPSAVPSTTSAPTTAPASTTLTLSFAFYSNTSTTAFYNSDAFNYQVKCPTGYSVPSQPNSKYLQWVTGTGCVVNCL